MSTGRNTNIEQTNTETKQVDTRAFVAIGLTASICWAFSYLSIYVFEAYSSGLFIWLPFVIGICSTLIYGYKNPHPKNRTFNIVMLTLLVFSLGLLVFAWEGLICLIMAFPLGFVFTWLGYWLGNKILRIGTGNTKGIVTILFLSVPAFMAFEDATPAKEKLRSVKTSIEINASATEVWKNVVAFPQLKEPTEFIFKAGIAYPINATITGNGAGAVRKCNFSTGTFVEPITIWDEPNVLRFSVVDQPDPMTELSFYNIKPNHLHGYWVSKEGEFRLIQLPNGHTLLEGTTWYVNNIKPGFYWAVWSDYIVHKIHQRVLSHIKAVSELK